MIRRHLTAEKFLCARPKGQLPFRVKLSLRKISPRRIASARHFHFHPTDNSFTLAARKTLSAETKAGQKATRKLEN